jgi:outer membrane protein assembly factor BamA
VRKPFFFILVFFLFVLSIAAGAQSRKAAANPNQITEITAVGSQRFSDKELVAASGLKIGDSGETAMKQAADRLAESGMFTDVSYNYVTAAQGTKVKLQVTDAQGFIPIHADNFVWLSQTDLISALEKREPLFRVEIPNGGEMYNKLAQDMQAILADMHVNSTVTVMPQTTQAGGTIIGFLYKVEGVNIPIRSVGFPGASPDMNAVLEQVAGRILINQDYSESKMLANEHYDFLPEYQKRGYLKAEFGEPVFTVQDPATNSVAVQVPLKEGLQYKLASVTWLGNKAFAANDLMHALECKPGQPLNAILLDENLGGLTKIYTTRGYMDVHAKPVFTFDDATQTVSAEIDVKEGDQFHMGQLQFVGLSDDAAASLRKLWKLTSADPYDSSYPNFFINQAARSFNFSHIRIATEVHAHNDTKTVDVAIHFTQTGS